MDERRSFILAVAVTAILSALVTGGIVYGWQHAKVVSLSEEVELLDSARDLALADLRESDLERQESLGPLEKRIEDLQEQVNELLEDPANSRIPMDFLTVYAGSSIHPDLPRSDYFIAVKRNVPVLDKLRILASKLSAQRFSELPIEVVGVKTVKGKRIATIDLRELHDDERLPTWLGHYFQGTTGGGLTQTTLVYTFLQTKYRSEWVDGVQFYYQGKPFEGDWDHISLSGVFYR